DKYDRNRKSFGRLYTNFDENGKLVSLEPHPCYRHIKFFIEDAISYLNRFNLVGEYSFICNGINIKISSSSRRDDILKAYSSEWNKKLEKQERENEDKEREAAVTCHHYY
ncbi:MAG: hypothetical protein IJW36_03730, partial [Clostridia bacterium]|nr:hypothetical protein [Clostridia bacterium]